MSPIATLDAILAEELFPIATLLFPPAEELFPIATPFSLLAAERPIAIELLPWLLDPAPLPIDTALGP